MLYESALNVKSIKLLIFSPLTWIPTAEKEIKIHYLRKHENITELNSKTILRDDYIRLNKLCKRFYKCNICANESAGLNWTMKPLRRQESIEFEKFVKEFDRRAKLNKEKVNKHFDVQFIMCIFCIQVPLI